MLQYIMLYVIGMGVSFGAIIILAKKRYAEWCKKYPKNDNEFSIVFYTIALLLFYPLFWSFMFWSFTNEHFWKNEEEEK